MISQIIHATIGIKADGIRSKVQVIKMKKEMSSRWSSAEASR